MSNDDPQTESEAGLHDDLGHGPVGEPPANDAGPATAEDGAGETLIVPAPLDTMTGIRDAIVETALMHVAFDGWTIKSLRAAAEDAGFEADQADRAFPEGPVQAVVHWCDLADRYMEADFKAAETDTLPMHEKVALAIRLRLQRWDMDREAVRRAVAVLSLPGHVRASMRSSYRTVDTVWWTVGDTTTDFNFYSKRLQLTAIYSATLLYWLDDSSEDSAETWGFLSRRLAGVVRLVKARRSLEQKLAKLPNPLSGLKSLAGGLGKIPRPQART